jgi:alpha-D-xyloside xylohydrolase
MKITICLIVGFFILHCQEQDVKSFTQEQGRVVVSMSEGTLCIYPLMDNAVRIKFYKGTEPSVPELIFISNGTAPSFHVSDSHSVLEVKMKKITVELDKLTGTLSLADKTGKSFLSEKAGTRKLIPDSVMGAPCYEAEQSFESSADEYIYGLGQFQDGHYNVKNITRKLTQVNSQISIPFIYSSKGYGLLWHQYGLTEFNPADNFITLEKKDQTAANSNQVAEVTTTSGTQKISQHQSLYTGHFAVPINGIYSLFLDLGDMDNRQYVVIDGIPVIDMSNLWLPPTACALVHLKAGDHQVQLVCRSSNSPTLSWKMTSDETTFRSPNTQLLDYVVFYGPSADSVIAAYRNLSGNVPMLPRWAYGFWQCRERYTSGTDLVNTVKEFRERNIPMDVIVQDWQYWGNIGWGVPQFDTTNYYNPAGFIKEIHDLNAHFNISIWSNPDNNSAIGKAFVSQNLFIPNTKWLDYFNPLTRKLYWNTLNKNLFSYGVDSWWMDATEPENDALHGQKTYLGPGDFYRLTYPLFVSRSVYEGQRETTSDKRVCILTRSAFSGQQRYGTINWSGDIGGTWDSYKRQIVAGLDYTITGMPYWTTDIGGFFRPGKSQYTDPKYQELLIRWYQWGAFNPIFRIHGYQSETEPWHFSQEVQNDMNAMLNLRYRLLPYIYSEAWQVTKNGSTIMRPLVMDFKEDSVSLRQEYEYMFGKSILVSPITEPDVRVSNVYLPKSAIWYDFWSGKNFEGGRTIQTDASLDKIPLFVKAGSIIPMSPVVQYADQKIDSLEIRIYPGKNGTYVLYEDENDNYNYEKGSYSIILFSWNDFQKKLTIGDRRGSFSGIKEKYIFTIVVQGDRYGIGMQGSSPFSKTIDYTGKKVTVNFE